MPQDPVERWERVAALVDAALQREPVERAAYLDEACAGEGALQAEVEALLAGAGAPSFLDSAAIIFAAPLLDASESGGERTSPAGSPEEATELLRALAREHQADLARSSAVPNGVLTERGLPYELERKLGRGGTATIYLARDAKHGRWVGVKVLNAELTACVGAQRFVQEIRLTARLQHPHVLGLLDSGVFGAEAGVLAGRPYYVMPYVEGESLRARLARGDSLASREAVRVLRDVADALCYAHEQGVVHRDIKPENILLSREHAMVADFGIAKALFASRTEEASDDASGTLTQFGALVGTPAYMAPEQAAGWSQVDHRADLYAWGVVAYELLAGRLIRSGAGQALMSLSRRTWARRRRRFVRSPPRCHSPSLRSSCAAWRRHRPSDPGRRQRSWQGSTRPWSPRHRPWRLAWCLHAGCSSG